MVLCYGLFSYLKGFDQKELLKACCGEGGNYNFGGFGKFCGVPGVRACRNPSAHFSWDGIHPTQEANMYITTWLITNMLPMLDCPSS